MTFWYYVKTCHWPCWYYRWRNASSGSNALIPMWSAQNTGERGKFQHEEKALQKSLWPQYVLNIAARTLVATFQTRAQYVNHRPFSAFHTPSLPVCEEEGERVIGGQEGESVASAGGRKLYITDFIWRTLSSPACLPASLSVCVSLSRPGDATCRFSGLAYWGNEGDCQFRNIY